MSARLSTTGEKRSQGTYQVQHDVKSDCLELFDLEKQKGRYLADFLRYIQCRAHKLSPVAFAVDSTDCRNSAQDESAKILVLQLKSGSVRSNGLGKKKKIIVNIYRPVSCKCIAQFRHSAVLFLEPL